VFKDAELAQCERILAGLAPEDRAFLEPRVLPQWLVRRRRLAARNGAIVAARMVFSQPRETVAAKELARALAGYRLSNWRGEAAIAALPEEGRLENSAGSVYTGDGADNAIGIAGGSRLETGGIFMRGFRHCAVPGVRRIKHLRGK
jgi:hypothetical protein